MKISVVSHSLVAPRQAIFFSRLGYVTGNIVQEIFPHTWNNHYRHGGYDVLFQGDMMKYTFDSNAENAIRRFYPELIYLQNEAYCEVAGRTLQLAKELHSKFCIFVWENIRDYEGEPKHIIESADFVICGNKEAEALVRKHNPKTTVLPQVGIDFDLFRPLDLKREYDAVFVGRPTPEKGINVIRKAFEDTDYKIWYANGIPYHGMPKVFNRAMVHLTPSLDTPVWKEQFAPYANIEALGCSCDVVASDSSAMKEWLDGCPGVHFVKQNSPDELRSACIPVFRNWGTNNYSGREWVKERFSCQKIAEELVKVFQRL